MKKVTFVEMAKKRFDRGDWVFAEREEAILPDCDTLFDVYRDNYLIRVKKYPDENNFLVVPDGEDFYDFDDCDENDLRIISVLDVEDLGHDDEIDGKDE